VDRNGTGLQWVMEQYQNGTLQFDGPFGTAFKAESGCTG